MISILTSIKKMLGIAEDYKHFDMDLIMHINSVFLVLTQLGVGPEEGFAIQDETTLWSDFIPEDAKLEAVKTYMYLKVKLIFDPPLGGATRDALVSVINEWEFRLKTAVESSQSSSKEVIQNG